LDITDLYKAIRIPGNKEGISGTIVSPYNIAINNYLDNENHKAAVAVIKYMTSKEVQRENLIHGLYSGIPSLYDEE